MAQSNGDELLKGLDTISEYNIKFGRGHGDLRDACHLCGISPAMLKEAILADRKQHELEARIDELISYGREVGLLDLRVKTALHERIEKLKAEREAL